MNEEGNTKHIDYDDFVKLTDQEVVLEILSRGLNRIDDFKILNLEEKRSLLKELKSIKGVSIRQLSRLTGLSRSIITKA